MRWEKVDIGTLVVLRQGFAINKNTKHYISNEHTNLPLLRIADMKDETKNVFVKDTIPKRFIARPDDIIYTRTGQVGLVFTKLFGVVHNNCFTVSPIDEKVLSRSYLYYALKNKEFFEAANLKATGAAQPDLPHGAFNTIPIYLPPIETQHRIADILSAYDDLIENNRKQIKLLEEAAQRLYKEWFVDLRFPGHEHTRIVDGVPEGWEKMTVFDVSSVLRRGISPQYNDQGRSVVINQKCIRHSIVDFSEARYQEKPFPEELNIQDSDTVICSTGAGTLGRVGQIFGKYPQTTCDSHVTLVRAKANFGKQYLFHSLKSRQSYLMGMGKGSTNQLELSRSVIQDLDILVPTIEIRNNFEELTQLIHDQIKTISAEIERLQDNRDRLLPKLMSGEVEL